MRNRLSFDHEAQSREERPFRLFVWLGIGVVAGTLPSPVNSIAGAGLPPPGGACPPGGAGAANTDPVKAACIPKEVIAPSPHLPPTVREVVIG